MEGPCVGPAPLTTGRNAGERRVGVFQEKVAVGQNNRRRRPEKTNLDRFIADRAARRLREGPMIDMIDLLPVDVSVCPSARLIGT